MHGILLRSRVGSVLIKPRKSLDKIAGSDKGFEYTHLFVDLDEDEDQTEKNWAPWVQSACAKALVFALEQYSPLFSFRVR